MNIIPFSFNSKEIRVVEINNEPWFVAKDICDALEFGNHRQALSTHIDSGDVQMMDTPTTSGIQRLNYVNESGMYALIFGSTKAGAKTFKKWVTAEVLPSIRKNGGYIAGQETDDPDLIMAKALQVAQSVIARKTAELQQAKETIAIQAPKAAFADRIAGADKGVLLGNFAKTVGMGPKTLFKTLRDMRVLMTGGNRHNLPFQEYIVRGYFSVTERPYEINDETRLSFTPLITGKGQQWLTNRLIAAGHLRAVAAEVTV